MRGNTNEHAELFGNDAALEALRGVTGWQYRDNAISKTFQPGSFRQAVALLNSIADAAEQQQQQPELTIAGEQLTVTLSNPSAGGVTGDDIKLATTIESHAHQQ